MIIIHFLLFSCFGKKETPTLSQQEQLTIFSLGNETITKNAIARTTNIQEKSQLYWLDGIQNHDIDSFVQSRAMGISCLHENSSFRIDQIQEPDVAWERFVWFPDIQCDQGTASNIIRIQKTSHHTACVTWTILSWSKLLQHYHLDHGAVDAHILFYLAAWLVENEGCIDTKWTSLAIAIALLQMENDPRIAVDKEVLRSVAAKRLEFVSLDQDIRDYAHMWYMIYLKRTGSPLEKEKSSWRERLEDMRTRGVQSKQEPFFSEMEQYLEISE